MNVAVGRAKRCHLGGRATGNATIFARFGNDGRISQIEIKGEPIGSAPVAKCIATNAGAVAIKPFEGEPFIVRQGITLR
jgi:hypothetical protein